MTLPPTSPKRKHVSFKSAPKCCMCAKRTSGYTLISGKNSGSQSIMRFCSAICLITHFLTCRGTLQMQIKIFLKEYLRKEMRDEDGK